jgi:putative sigma-54 modulation protein
MKLTHTFRHLDHSESLEQYATQGILEVSRFLLKGGHGSVEYSKRGHIFCINVAINTREKYFKASAENDDVYAAVDEAISKLGSQIMKVKKTIKNHKRPELSKEGRLKRLNSQFEVATRYKKAA